MSIRFRRLDDRIQALCADAITAKNPHRLKRVIAELQSAIHEYTRRLRNRAISVLGGHNGFPHERRRS